MVALYEVDEDIKAEWPTKEITVGLPKRVEVDGEMIPIQSAPLGTSVIPIKAAIPQPDGLLVKVLRKKTIQADKIIQ